MNHGYTRQQISASKLILYGFRRTFNTIQQALKNRTPQLNGEKYLTNREVCQLLRISPRTLQNWRDTGKIPFIRLKGKILYKESEILKELK